MGIWCLALIELIVRSGHQRQIAQDVVRDSFVPIMIMTVLEGILTLDDPDPCL
ncbi:hypothetical protein ACLOJK_030271 [Asimina triloba]